MSRDWMMAIGLIQTNGRPRDCDSIRIWHSADTGQIWQPRPPIHWQPFEEDWAAYEKQYPESVVEEGDSMLTILNKRPLTVWVENDFPEFFTCKPIQLYHSWYNGFGSLYEHRSTYFNPITTPVWDFEHTFFNYYPVIQKIKPLDPIMLPYSYWQSRQYPMRTS